MIIPLKNTKLISFFVVIFLIISLCRSINGKGYEYNPLVPIELWQELEPYFLPIDHPLKKKFDKIFESKRVIQDATTFKAAGFGEPKIRAATNIVLGKNRNLNGCLIKVFLDTQPCVHEYGNFLSRIKGAQSIQACIDKYGFKKYFKVPKKWLYPLPFEPAPPISVEYNRKNFILVVEDMKILSTNENHKAFKQRCTKEMLTALYTVLSEEGLLDSVFINNIPFNVEGKICFIDTEHHHHTIVPYHRLTKYLSEKMQIYWLSLIQNK